MMNVIVDTRKNRTVEGDRQTLEWHVGDTVTPTFHRLAHNVLEVQADGDELAHIRTHNLALVPTGRRMVRFFGDDAKRIVGNL